MSATKLVFAMQTSGPAGPPCPLATHLAPWAIPIWSRPPSRRTQSNESIIFQHAISIIEIPCAPQSPRHRGDGGVGQAPVGPRPRIQGQNSDWCLVTFSGETGASHPARQPQGLAGRRKTSNPQCEMNRTVGGRLDNNPSPSGALRHHPSCGRACTGHQAS